MANDDAMIRAAHLDKWFGPIHAVHDLTFEVPRGQILGFLGPNGAGKSTTLRMLTGYLPPTRGQATIAGHDVIKQSGQARASVGYLPESTPLYGEMRVDEYLHYRGRLMGMGRRERKARIDLVCDRCGLSHNRRRVIGHLSKGNRQRVGLAQALLHDPPVLVLDEPTAGFDPNQIMHFRDLIAELKGRHTIILSSHILPEIEKTADRIMIIASGVIVAEGTMEELRRTLGGLSRLYVEVKAAPEAVTRAVRSIEGVQEVQTQAVDGWCHVTITPAAGRDLREPVGGVVNANGWVVRELRPEGGTLEAFFINITAEQAQAQGEAP